MVRPDQEDCALFSKERIAPMVRDNPCLRGLLSDTAQGGKDTLSAKSFPGGILALVGSRSPTGLANRPIRYLLADEIDKYPVSAGKEGDPYSLAWKRTTTFGYRRKGIRCCSPTVAGISQIGKAYRETDMRRPWVKCPYCGFEQVLRWEQVKDVSGGSFSHNNGATARYECANGDCKAKWTDIERRTAANSLVWKADRPEITKKAGFWISHLYSPWPANDLHVLAAEYLKAANDVNLLKTFKNTSLAEEWQEEGSTPDFQTLYERRESYKFGPPDIAIIPQRGLFLTAAVDVQESPPRLEYEVVAWGRGRECWSVCYGIIEALAPNQQPLPVTSREVWDKLDSDVLQPLWRHESGHLLPISVMAIDTGRRPKPVYEFARRHPQLRYSPAGYTWYTPRTVVPIKGTPDPLKLLSSVSKEDAAKKQQGVRIIGIGTHCAKQEIFDSLLHIRPTTDPDRPNPGYYHHPMYGIAYFQGVCSEVRVIKDNGKVEWEQRNPRNEPLDLRVYNRAAASILGIDRWGEEQWRRLEEAVRRPKTEAETVALERPPQLPQPPTQTQPANPAPASLPARPPQPAAVSVSTIPRRPVVRGVRRF